MISEMISEIINGLTGDIGTVGSIVGMLLMTLIMSIYEFIIYRTISKKALYDKQMHMAMLVIPFFIASIVMALQSDVIITLGTIGALAIIRFRTAIKDPMDMVYILWSIFIGISCGCHLYKLCILTTVMVTFVLIVMEFVNEKLFTKPFILIVNSKSDIEKQIDSILKETTKSYRTKSRNFTEKGVNYVFEICIKDVSSLNEKINKVDEIIKYSILSYDNNDII